MVAQRRLAASHSACAAWTALRASRSSCGISGSGVPYATGYVYWPAVAGIAAASVLTAPLGARLAHTLPVPQLRRAFALLLAVVGLRMLLV